MLGSWNVRGLNAVDKQREVVHYIRSNKLSLVGLLETKLNKEKLEKC